MIPTEYRLEQVVARLISRLDGARRSYESEAELAEACRRIADGYVHDAVGEWNELGFADDPKRHAAFLRTEVLETFLPRYVRAAHAINNSERNGYGVGWLAAPLGRVFLVVSVALAMFLELRMFGTLAWPIMALELGLVFLPDITRTMSVRRYRNGLEEIVDDMARIQDQAHAYQPTTDTSEQSEEEARLDAARRAAQSRQGQ